MCAGTASFIHPSLRHPPGHPPVHPAVCRWLAAHKALTKIKQQQQKQHQPTTVLHGQVTQGLQSPPETWFVPSLSRGQDRFPFPRKGGTGTLGLVGRAQGPGGSGDPGFLLSRPGTHGVGVGWA